MSDWSEQFRTMVAKFREAGLVVERDDPVAVRGELCKCECHLVHTEIPLPVMVAEKNNQGTELCKWCDRKVRWVGVDESGVYANACANHKGRLQRMSEAMGKPGRRPNRVEPTEYATQYPELATERALAPSTKAAILAAMYLRMPNMRGAHVADVLAIQHDADDRLDLLEPMYEEHDDWTALHGYAVLALSWIKRSVSWDEVDALARTAARQEVPE